MKRKINKVGQNTLTISLPSSWASKYRLKKGDELELSEDGSFLVVGTGFKPKNMEISIDLSDMGNMLARTIAAIYKAGFDNARITYKTAEELKIIQDTIYRYCHVYEIMNVTKNVVEIKSISQLDPSEFPEMLRKSAHAILTIAMETYDALKNKEFDILENIILKDKIVDRYTAFGSRVLNKGHDIGLERTGTLYLIFDETEISADIFKVICKEAIKNKINVSAPVMSFFHDILVLMQKQYDLLFDFKIEKIKEIGKLEKEIREEIDVLCKKEKNEIKILAYLINLFETIFEMKSAIITFHIGMSNQIRL